MPADQNAQTSGIDDILVPCRLSAQQGSEAARLQSSAGQLDAKGQRQRQLEVATRTLSKRHPAESKALGATAEIQKKKQEELR